MHPDALAARLACILLGYLFGSFLTAEVVARVVSGKSARQLGTGNPGMANIATHLGKKAGLLVLAGDIIKTAVACWFCHQLAPELGLTALLYGGLGAVLGHNWSIWYKGRGGKGVAVTCAWLMLYLPVTGVLCCLAGGVAANGRLRQLVNDGAQKLGAKIYLPELKFCGDNGAMIAAQGYYQYMAGHTAGLELNGLPTLPIDYE